MHFFRLLVILENYTNPGGLCTLLFERKTLHQSCGPKYTTLQCSLVRDMRQCLYRKTNSLSMYSYVSFHRMRSLCLRSVCVCVWLSLRINFDLFTSTSAYVGMHQPKLCKYKHTHSAFSPWWWNLRSRTVAKLKDNSFVCQHQLPKPCCYFKLEAAVHKWWYFG